MLSWGPRAATRAAAAARSASRLAESCGPSTLRCKRLLDMLCRYERQTRLQHSKRVCFTQWEACCARHHSSRRRAVKIWRAESHDVGCARMMIALVAWMRTVAATRCCSKLTCGLQLESRPQMSIANGTWLLRNLHHSNRVRFVLGNAGKACDNNMFMHGSKRKYVFVTVQRCSALCLCALIPFWSYCAVAELQCHLH